MVSHHFWTKFAVQTTEGCDIHTGASGWIRLAHFAIFLAAMITLTASNAALPAKILTIGALLFAFGLIARRLAKFHAPGRLRVFADGVGWLSDTRTDKQADRQIRILNHAWVSRWFCMVPCRELDSGNRRDVMVCASDNDSDDYRRLLTALRSRSCAEKPGVSERG